MAVLLKRIVKFLPMQKNVTLSLSASLKTGFIEGFCQDVFQTGNQEQEYRKLKASTLIEVLVASVLIIIVFTIASLTLNNVFKSTIKSNTHAIDTQINKLIYLHEHDKIGVKYQEDFKDWYISFSQEKENNIIFIEVTAIQNSNNALSLGAMSKGQSEKKKTITKRIINDNAQ